MSASQVLQRLYLLGVSSPDLSRLLYGLIRHDKDEQYSSSLEGAELAQLVDFLDKALHKIPTTDDVFRQCLRKLRAICGYHATLPSSHIIRGDLARIGESPIANGGFADVWEGTHGGGRVCIKVLRVSLRNNKSLTKSFFKEAVVWKRLKHPNVAPFLGVTNKPLQFVSEWMSNGTLTEYISKNPDADRIVLLLDVAEGLNYLHTSYTIHGDLKGPNILVDHNGRACLTDFGLASIVCGINSVLITHVHGFTPRWTAPEILKGVDEIKREADIFSFGMVVIEAFTGAYPFSDLNTSPQVMFKIMNGGRPVRPQESQELGLVDPVWDMTVNCWQQYPAHRPKMARVLEFLRECYTLRVADPHLSDLTPWQPAGNADDATNRGVISPMPTDENPSPTQSLGTSQHSGQSSFSGPFFDESRAPPNLGATTGDHPDVGIQGQNTPPRNNRSITPPDGNGRRKPVRSATSDEKNPMSYMYELSRHTSLPAGRDPRPATPVGSGSKHGSRHQLDQREGRLQNKRVKALWSKVVTAVAFISFAKRKSEEGRDDV